MIDKTHQNADIVMTGSVPFSELPAHYAAGDVFSMPCRTRNRGLDVEGLGIVYLEASATGIPVVAGDSGGAPDAVIPGETGFVVPGGSPAAAAARSCWTPHSLRRWAVPGANGSNQRGVGR